MCHWQLNSAGLDWGCGAALSAGDVPLRLLLGWAGPGDVVRLGWAQAGPGDVVLGWAVDVLLGWGLGCGATTGSLSDYGAGPRLRLAMWCY